ncbi:MAG: outer membrane protein assembly factor BamA [Candidatus Omnitrophota bacterium]
MKKNIFFFLILALVLFSSCVYGQEESSDSLLVTQAQASEAVAQDGPIVSEIKIQGNTSISEENILSKIKTRVNQPYVELVISDDIKRLYSSGYFSEVNVDTENIASDKIKIIFTVVEKPLIDEFKIVGSRILPRKKIEDSIMLRKGAYLDYSQLNLDVDTIKDLYVKRGYPDVSVIPNAEVDKTSNKAKVIITIEEGLKAKIRSVKFEGNNSIKSNKLLELMKTKPANIFLLRMGILKEIELDEDLERVKMFYQREGFSDVEVDSKVEPTLINGRTFIDITIVINEGKKYLTGDIIIEGNKVFTTDQIRKKLENCIPGKVYSQDAMREDVFIIQQMYYDKGYISVKITDTVNVSPKTGLVDIKYVIIENDIAYVNLVKVKGNTKTKDVVIRRELRLYPGDRFDGSKIRRSRERLQNLGFFEEVNFDTENSNVEDKKNLVVEVKESKTGQFSVGGGYSTVDKLVGFIEVEQKNFDWKNFPYFTGDGQNLKLRAEAGSVTNNFNLSFTEPWIFDYPLSFGFDVYKWTHSKDSSTGYAYNENRVGGDVRFSKDITEYISAGLTYKLENIKIKDVDTNAGNELKKEEGNNRISSMTLGAAFDNRDNILNPMKGTYLGGNVETAGGPWGGTKNFVKTRATFKQYFPIIKVTVLELRLMAGIANSFGDSDEVPIYERYFAGGSDTIRGYHERKVGPIDPQTDEPIGGEAIMVGNIEYIFPIFQFVKGAAFYDIGNVWEKVENFGSGHFRSGIGVGLRVKTPMGPVRIDYGYPLNLEPGEEKRSGKFHFSMGSSF